MSSKRRRRPNPRHSHVLFVVADPRPPPAKLIEWPEDPAEAAAIIALCKKVAAQHDALKAQGHDYAAWDDRTSAMLKGVREFERAHPGAFRQVDGRMVYSDEFRRYILSLARGPGLGMSLLKLSTATGVEEEVLAEWLAETGDARK